ncbi:MAG: hypothetical protein LBJ02_12400 [Bifidobacteriaceae bacterium]|jgi:hypothetical protein|nr:hypothetical protein [Bifidobacteriaceae bacterium]
MLKLYKHEGGELHYAEYWADGGVATIHVGQVGDTGSSEKTPCADEGSFERDFRQRFTAQGYAEWPEGQHWWLALQWPMDTFGGNAAIRAMRNKAMDILDDLLGWTGLGHVDGFDMGRTASPEEKFAVNVFCVVVDAETAVKRILETLPEQLDCAQLKIGLRSESQDATFKLRYAAPGEDGPFYL